MTDRNEPLFFWIWLRNEPLFFLNNHFFWIWLTELNFFSQSDSKTWAFFSSKYDLQELNFCQKYDSKDWFLCFEPKPFLKTMWLQELKLVWFGRWIFSIWIKELSLFPTISLNYWPFLNMTHRIEHLVQKHDSQNRLKTWLIEIEPFFSTWLKEMTPFLVRLKAYFYFTNDMTRRINWSFCENMTQRIFSRKMTLWIEPFQKLTPRIELFFLKKKIKELNPFLFFSMWLKDFNFLQTLRMEPFSKNMTHSKNSTFLNLFIWLKELDLCYMSQRIELFAMCLKELSRVSKWLKELKNPFLNMTQRIELLSMWLKELNMTQIIELFLNMSQKNLTFLGDSKNWIFSITWLRELNPFQHDSQNWTFLFHVTYRNWTLLLNMTPRIEPVFSTWLKENVSFFELDSKNISFLTQCMTQRINWSFWENMTRTSFLEHEAQNWTSLVLNMTHGIEPFFNLTLRMEPFSWIWLKELNLFSQSDSKNWIFFLKVTQRIVSFFSVWLEELNPFFWICLNELNPFVDWLIELNPVFFFVSIWLKDLTLSKNMTLKNWTFWLYESKDWTFESVTQSTEPSFQYESTNRTHFSNMSQRIDFFFLNKTHRNFSKL